MMSTKRPSTSTLCPKSVIKSRGKYDSSSIEKLKFVDRIEAGGPREV